MMIGDRQRYRDLAIVLLTELAAVLALRLAELELIGRERRMVERRIKEARFPAVKSLDSFAFAAIPALNKTLVLELARSEYAIRRDNIIAVGNSGTGKTHISLGLGVAACQKGLSVGFYTAAATRSGCFACSGCSLDTSS